MSLPYNSTPEFMKSKQIVWLSEISNWNIRYFYTHNFHHFSSPVDSGQLRKPSLAKERHKMSNPFSPTYYILFLYTY